MPYQFIVNTLLYFILELKVVRKLTFGLVSQFGYVIEMYNLNNFLYQFLLGNFQIKAPEAYIWRGYYKRPFCVSNIGVLYSGWRLILVIFTVLYMQEEEAIDF